MMKLKILSVLSVGALALAACGDSQELAQGAEDEGGGLSVSIHNVDESDVQLVRLKIQADPAVNPNQAVSFPDVDLEPTGPGVVRNAGGAISYWTYTATGIPVGSYLVSAEAFDNTGGTGTPIFTSGDVPVVVVTSPTVVAHLFLRQTDTGDDFDTPYISGVSFNGKPAFDKVSTITVVGDGGEGVLELDAQGVGLFGGNPAVAPNWEDGSGDAKAGGATILWTPDAPQVPGTAEDQDITVRLTDTAGNNTSLKMSINVDHERGDIDFRIEFNHAPEMKVSSTSVNDDIESVVILTATYSDTEYTAEEITYEWDLEDCEDAGFDITDTGSAYASGGPTKIATADIDADGLTSHVVTLTRAAAAVGTPPTCVIAVTITDQGLQDGSNNWVAGSESTRTQNINVTVGTVSVDYNP